MTPLELQELAQVCREAGIATLKVGDVEIVMGPPLPLHQRPTEAPPPPPIAEVPPAPSIPLDKRPLSPETGRPMTDHEMILYGASLGTMDPGEEAAQ